MPFSTDCKFEYNTKSQNRALFRFEKNFLENVLEDTVILVNSPPHNIFYLLNYCRFLKKK